MKKIISFMFSVALFLSASVYANAGALSDLAAQSGRNLQKNTASAPTVSKAESVSTPAEANAAAIRNAQSQTAEWLVMVYIAGMNNLGLFGAAKLNVNDMERGLFQAGEAASNVRFVVEYGELSTDGMGNLNIPDALRTLLVMPDNDANVINSKVIGISKGADTGNVKTLDSFVRRVLPRFPAKKKALIIWNHGGGIGGIASDDIHGSMMNLKNLSRTLRGLVSSYGKFDVIATDACLMQMASIAYEFKDYANVVIGSEQPIPGNGYPYFGLSRILAVSGSGMDGRAFGQMLVSGYGQAYSRSADTSLSAIDTSKFPGFISRINRWAGLIMSDSKSFGIISKANVLKEVSRMSELDCSRDLVHMISVINSQAGVSQAIKDAGNDLANYVRGELLIANYAYDTNQNFGLAIYLPDLVYEANPYETLKFSADSNWSKLVRKILQSRLDNGW